MLYKKSAIFVQKGVWLKMELDGVDSAMSVIIVTSSLKANQGKPKN